MACSNRNTTRTIHVHQSVSIANQSVRGRSQVVHADAQADLLDDLIGVFCIDVVLDDLRVALLQVRCMDLYEVGDLGLVVSLDGIHRRYIGTGETNEDEHVGILRY